MYELLYTTQSTNAILKAIIMSILRSLPTKREGDAEAALA